MERVPELVGPRNLTALEIRTIGGMLDAHAPLVDVKRFNALVAGFRSGSPLDPYRVVCELAGCSREMTALLRADLGLLRPCRLYEHTQGVLDGLERDYIAVFPAASQRRVLRLAALLGDIGKSLCVAQTGSNLDQLTYNARLADNLIATLSTATMSAAEREAVRLLLGCDVIGGALQGRFDYRVLQQLRDAWPRSLASERDDLVLAAYLADATAHTEYRSHRDAGTLQMIRCIVPGDEALTWVFEAGAQGQLALRVPEHRRIVAALFPGLQATAELVAPYEGDWTPAADTREVARFEEDAVANGTWSADLQLGSVPFPELRQVLMRFAREHDFPITAFVRARWGIAVALTLTRAPNAGFGTPTVATCERAVQQLIYQTGWQPVASTRPAAGLTVAMGLRDDEDTRAPRRRADEAFVRLLEHARAWHTSTPRLVFARAVDGEVQWHDEPGFVITASPKLLPYVLELAHTFGRQRIVITDVAARRTYTLRRARSAGA
jgi:hypothetical protein